MSRYANPRIARVSKNILNVFFLAFGRILVRDVVHWIRIDETPNLQVFFAAVAFLTVSFVPKSKFWNPAEKEVKNTGKRRPGNATMLGVASRELGMKRAQLRPFKVPPRRIRNECSAISCGSTVLMLVLHCDDSCWGRRGGCIIMVVECDSGYAAKFHAKLIKEIFQYVWLEGRILKFHGHLRGAVPPVLPIERYTAKFHEIPIKSVLQYVCLEGHIFKLHGHIGGAAPEGRGHPPLWI